MCNGTKQQVGSTPQQVIQQMYQMTIGLRVLYKELQGRQYILQ